MPFGASHLKPLKPPASFASNYLGLAQTDTYILDNGPILILSWQENIVSCGIKSPVSTFFLLLPPSLFQSWISLSPRKLWPRSLSTALEPRKIRGPIWNVFHIIKWLLCINGKINRHTESKASQISVWHFYDCNQIPKYSNMLMTHSSSLPMFTRKGNSKLCALARSYTQKAQNRKKKSNLLVWRSIIVRIQGKKRAKHQLSFHQHQPSDLPFTSQNEQ